MRPTLTLGVSLLCMFIVSHTAFGSTVEPTASDLKMEVIAPGEVDFRLADAPGAGVIRAQHPPVAGARRTADGWSVAVEAHGQVERPVLAALVTGASVVAAAHGGWSADPPAMPPVSSVPFLAWLLVIPPVVLLRFRRMPVTFAVRLPHALPAAIQASVLGYWAVYWPPAVAHLPTIVGQLGLAYALDAWLSLRTRGGWVIGLGPVPIVLSINLFLWFGPVASMAVVAVAMAVRLLWQREGRHVLNPSATALGLVGLWLTVLPGGSYEPLFHTMNLPPFIGEWILVAALVPQLRLGIVAVTLGAWFGNSLLSPIGPAPSLTRPASILAFALLATDPATIPRSTPGRLLFGLAFGAGVRVASILLVALGQPDDLSKVLPLPICNALTPQFDALAGRLRLDRWVRPEHNRWHVLGWFLVATAALAREKAENFESALHWTWQTPGVEAAADGVPDCVDNADFCAAFGWAR